MADAVKRFTEKLITAVVVAIASGFFYEQARKVGQKSEWLTQYIEAHQKYIVRDKK